MDSIVFFGYEQGVIKNKIKKAYSYSYQGSSVSYIIETLDESTSTITFYLDADRRDTLSIVSPTDNGKMANVSEYKKHITGKDKFLPKQNTPVMLTTELLKTIKNMYTMIMEKSSV